MFKPTQNSLLVKISILYKLGLFKNITVHSFVENAQHLYYSHIYYFNVAMRQPKIPVEGLSVLSKGVCLHPTAKLDSHFKHRGQITAVSESFQHIICIVYGHLMTFLQEVSKMLRMHQYKQGKCLLAPVIYIWPQRNHACFTSSEWDVRLLAVVLTVVACSFTLQTRS